MLLTSNLTQIIDSPTRLRNNQNPSFIDLFLTSDLNLVSKICISSPVGKSYQATVECELQFFSQKLPRNVNVHHSYSNKLSTDLRQARADYENNLIDKGPKPLYKYMCRKTSSKVSELILRKENGVCIRESNTTNLPLISSQLSSNFFDLIQKIMKVVRNELLNLRENSAPGLDKITAKLLKFYADVVGGPLTHLMQCTFLKSELPSDWLLAWRTSISEERYLIENDVTLP
ncbi:hypothetical protein BDFB_012495, partial [Asbolus verrucosus]